ncbi:unnamed protein product [Acanthosepion pharaonis]|uniref:Uncharacterized protein n=1 Tax=Acanthosepion pharaonis TaxID=158019 RepID=A0A812B1Y8_ACAPH|nr:unnamed protein product [Sepia pharaonis]
MFTLIGFNLSSAAAIETGENDTPKSMDDFKENLENLLHVFSEAIQEKAESDENMDLKDLIPEIKIHDEDDKLEVPNEEPSIETEEEEDPLSDEISTDENDENANSRIYCYWRGRRGHCCKRLRISRIRLHVCLSAYIYPPRYMKITLRLNGHTLWRHTLRSRHRYRIKQATIETVSDVDTVLIIKIFRGFLEHHAEEHSEESRYQNATLPYTVVD